MAGLYLRPVAVSLFLEGSPMPPPDVSPLSNPAAAPTMAPTTTPAVGAWAWARFKAFFGPVGSLFTARTIWLAALLTALGVWIGWRDVKLFGLAAMWSIVGVSIAYYARKLLVPEVKAAEYYELARAGNIAAAIITIRIALVELACILVVALSALGHGV